MITEGCISVQLDDAMEGGDEEAKAKEADDVTELTNDHQYPGRAYPMKVTDLIPNDVLLAMLKRYWEAYEKEDRGGMWWCARHNEQRKGTNISFM